MAAEQNNAAERAANYTPEDREFYDFWYGHMLGDVMQAPLADVAHSTARYIWDAGRWAPASIGEDGLPPVPWGDDFEAWLEPRRQKDVREAFHQYARDAVAADRQARAITETLNNPPYGEPDLYSRLHTALTNELALAKKFGKVTEWFNAARGLIDYLARQADESGPQAAQGVKTWQERLGKDWHLAGTLQHFAARDAEIAELRARLAAPPLSSEQQAAESPDWRALGYVEGATVRQRITPTKFEDAVITCAHGNGALDVEINGKAYGWSARNCTVLPDAQQAEKGDPNAG
jgi:hypothetical protein